MKILWIVSPILVVACFAQNPGSPACVSARVVPDSSAKANQARMQSIDLAGSPEIRQGAERMQQLLSVLASDAKYRSDQEKMRLHIQSLATDPEIQKQKADMEAVQRQIESSPERASQVAKFLSDAAVCQAAAGQRD